MDAKVDVKRLVRDVLYRQGALQNRAKTRDGVKDLILPTLTLNGHFYRDGARVYYLYRETGRVMPIEPGDPTLEQTLYERFGVLPRDPIGRDLIDMLALHAAEKGTKTTIHRLAHYDPFPGQIYLFDHERTVRRITATELHGFQHGDNNVLFVRQINHETYNLVTLPADLEPAQELLNAITGGVTFLDGAVLTAEDQRYLLVAAVLSLFVPERFPTKPIFTFIGPKGSGKTSLCRRIGEIPFGPTFDVTPLGTDAKDFEAAITNEALIVVDNVDEAPKWFADKLAVIATGGTFARRVYYTTNTLSRYPITATVFLTARTPNFTREDVAERLVIFTLGRRAVFIPEHELAGRSARSRDRVMSLLVRQLQRVIPTLTGPGHPDAQGFRMADFADFFLRVGPTIGCPDPAGVLKRLDSEQVAFVTKDAPIFDLIDEWLAGDGAVNIGPEIASGALYEELLRLARAGSAADPALKSPRTFGTWITQNFGTLHDRYGLTEREGGGNKRFLTFHHRAE